MVALPESIFRPTVMIFKVLKEVKQSAPNAASRKGVTDGFSDIVNPKRGGGGALCINLDRDAHLRIFSVYPKK